MTQLKLYDPKWGSKLAGTIIELEKLRIKQLGGPVPPYIFFQLKNIFQLLESLGSARIEGNNTTLADFVEKIIEPSNKTMDESMKEIDNIESAINFIEQEVDRKTNISRALLSEVHKILTRDLSAPPKGEGSQNPGELRKINVSIKGSNHNPPEVVKVSEYFDELLSFINNDVHNQYHLLSMAIAHHRMAWIHPYDNGNGRMVRMLTYMLLIKQGFQVKSGRILNPTAIFCMDRDLYYAMLSEADKGTEEGVLKWCEYVLEGLRIEIEKIDKLLNLDYVINSVLLPMLEYAFDRKHLTDREYKILKYLVQQEEMMIKSNDLIKIIDEESPVQRSRIIRKLLDKKMLRPLNKGGRRYTIGFVNNYLLRGIFLVLETAGFVPAFLNKNNS